MLPQQFLPINTTLKGGRPPKVTLSSIDSTPHAKEIFFPYPTRYDINQKIEPNTKGQLLMVFEKGFVAGGK
jgi:hypothetical protein